MLRTRDPDAVGRNRPGRRILQILSIGLLLFAAGVQAQEALYQGEPFRGDEPLPSAFTGPNAPLATWYYRFVGTTLRPRQNDVSFATNGSGGCVYVTAGNASTVWNAPLVIPDGSTIQFLRIYVNDTSASDLWGWFTIYDLFGAIVQEWGISSSGTPGETWFDTAAINHVIDYSTYSYVVNMRPVGTGSTLQFCGARVFYAE